MNQVSRVLDSPLTPQGHAAGWFAKLMFLTAEASGTKVTETRIRVYAADLADIPREQVEAAVGRVRREGSGFFPTVAEIRRQIHPSPEDAALQAWTGLVNAASAVGGYASLEIEDPFASVALATVFGGWVAFCREEQGPGMALKRQEFLAAYREARRTPPSEMAEPVRFPGMCEASGNYQMAPQVWCGRLTAGGVLITQRERPVLVPGPDRPQLPPGEEEEFDESLGDA